MNEAYLDTYFIPSFDRDQIPDHAFIITAYNPMDEKLPDDENRSRNQTLLAKIRSYGVESLPIIGCSRDLSHQEPSFLINSSKNQAILWANEFNQRAIFEINNNELIIVSCKQVDKTISIGSFLDRWIESP